MLNWISAVPVKAAKPGMLRLTAPARLPAAPPGVMTNPPKASSMVTTPPPRLRSTPAMATLTTEAPVDVVACSMENEPDSVWPSTEMAPVPVARTYWPASSVSVSVPIVALTAWPVALISTVTAAPTLTPVTPRATDPENRPANPFGPMTNRAVPPEMVARPPPSDSDTLVAATATSEPFVWNTKSPPSVWPNTARVIPRPATRTNGPASSTSACSTPPTTIVSSTAALVWLSSTTSWPLRATLGMATATVTLNRPAMPAAVASRLPCPLASCSSPPPSDSATFAMPTRTTTEPSSVVRRSNTKSPRSDWPPMTTVRSSASTRRYGPAGSTRSMSCPATRSRSLTATPVVLTARLARAAMVTPGTTRLTSAARRPAIPVGVRTKLPAPPVSSSTGVPAGPRSSVTPVAAMRVIGVPPAVVTRSMLKSPSSVWPAIVRSTSSPVTRKYGPAGTTRPVSLTAAPVVLTCRVNTPSKAMPGRVTATAPDREAAMPAAVISSVPAPSVNCTTPPSSTVTLAAVTTIAVPCLANVKSPRKV